MRLDLNNRVFRSVANTENGDVGAETRFYYRQDGNLVTANYRGGDIRHGQLIALMREDGRLDMRYHHVTVTGEFKLGRCVSTPEVLPDGRLRFRERWQWLSGDRSEGTSEIEEVGPETSGS